MALLSMCLEAGMQPAIVHVNYHHQMQAEKEEAYLRHFACENHLEIYVKNDSFTWKGNFEAAARKYRYDFFKETVDKYKYDGVLIAHQMDDLLETYLMQKERNLVPACWGLAEEMQYHGMPVKRPLLSQTRHDILDYCCMHHIRYFIDETNADTSYARNRIRKRVEKMDLPERNEMLSEIKQKNRELFKERAQADELLENKKVNLAKYRNQKESVRLFLLRKLTDDSEWHDSLAHLKEIDNVIMSRNDFMISVKEQYLVSDQHSFFLHACGQPYSYTFKSLEEILSFPGNKCFCIQKGEKGTNSVTVSEKDFPVIIRNWKDGDSISMRFGTKSVHRFFIDRHIPIYKRKNWPIVENRDGHVILVPGLGCDKEHWSISSSFSVLQYSASDGGKS